MQVDGERIPLSAGNALRISPAGERCWRATGAEPLVNLVVQVTAGSLEQTTASDGIVCARPVSWWSTVGRRVPCWPGPVLLDASRVAAVAPAPAAASEARRSYSGRWVTASRLCPFASITNAA